MADEMGRSSRAPARMRCRICRSTTTRARAADRAGRRRLARRLINLLEQTQTAAATAQRASIDGAFIDSTLAQSLRRFDKGGEAFYDQISALHKSVRSS